MKFVYQRLQNSNNDCLTLAGPGDPASQSWRSFPSSMRSDDTFYRDEGVILWWFGWQRNVSLTPAVPYSVTVSSGSSRSTETVVEICWNLQKSDSGTTQDFCCKNVLILRFVHGSDLCWWIYKHAPISGFQPSNFPRFLNGEDGELWTVYPCVYDFMTIRSLD